MKTYPMQPTIKILTACALLITMNPASLSCSDFISKGLKGFSDSISIKSNSEDSNSNAQVDATESKKQHKRLTRYAVSYMDLNSSNTDEAQQARYIANAILSELTRTKNKKTNSLIYQVPNSEDSLNFLQIAAMQGDHEFVSNLVSEEHGANVDAKSTLGNTALHFATTNKQASAAQILLDHNAKIDIANNNNITAYDLALPGTQIYSSMRKKYPQASANNARIHGQQISEAGSAAIKSITQAGSSATQSVKNLFNLK